MTFGIPPQSHYSNDDEYSDEDERFIEEEQMDNGDDEQVDGEGEEYSE